MKLILLKTNLKEGLDVAIKAIKENNNLPILRNVLLKSHNGQIKISATNLELAIIKTISGKIIEDGEVTIPGVVFLNIVNNLPDERVNLETKDNNLIIKSENYEAKIQGISGDDFPLIPQIKNKDNYLKISSNILKESLSQIISAAQYSDWRPELNCVLFEWKPPDFLMIATDSFRLAKKVVPANQIEINWSQEKLMIPIKTIHELVKVLKDGVSINIYFDQNQIVFTGDDLEITSRVVDGKFPDYEAIIPKSFDTEVIVERENLFNALKLVGIFAGKVSDIHLKIPEGGKSLEIYSADSQLGENRYVLPVKSGRSLPEVVFNWRYFLDGLKSITNKEIFMGFNGNNRPALLRPIQDQAIVYLLMPIKA